MFTDQEGRVLTGHTQLWPKFYFIYFFGVGSLEIKQNNNYSFCQQPRCLSSWNHIYHLALNSWSVLTRIINKTNTITIIIIWLITAYLLFTSSWPIKRKTGASGFSVFWSYSLAWAAVYVEAWALANNVLVCVFCLSTSLGLWACLSMCVFELGGQI